MSNKEHNVATIAMQKAKECLQNNNDGLAFANFLLVFKLAPQLRDAVECEFLDCMGRWSEALRQANRSEDLLKCLHEACSVLPDHSPVLNAMGTELFNLGFLDEAASYFRKSLRADDTFLLARTNLQNLCSHVVERWHFRMLNDSVRNKAYNDAISRAVTSGQHTVLDIGSGTGLLSMFAAKAGASSVHGCEMSKVMYDISTDCVAQNELSGQIVLMNKASTEISIPEHIPERISLLVTETFDAGLLGEHILTTLSHAWEHLLINKPSQKSMVIPRAATVYICAVESEWLRMQHRVIYPGTRYLEFGDYRFVCQMGSTEVDLDVEPYTSQRLCDLPGGYRHLSEVIPVQRFTWDDPKAVQEYHTGFSHIHKITFTSQGHLDALVLWFDLHLDDHETLSSNPAAESCWEQAIYPVFPTHFKDNCDSLNVGQNDQLTFCVQCKNNALHIKSSQMIRHSSNTTITIPTFCDGIPATLGSNDAANTSPQFVLSKEEISLINDLTWNQAHCQALEEVKVQLMDSPAFAVLFILGGVSLLPLQALKLGAKEVCVVSSSPVIENMLTHIAEVNNLSVDSLEFVCSMDNLEGCWNVLVSDVVECCGSLRTQILEDIALAKMTSLCPSCHIIPQCISIYGILVESDSLLQDSCVISEENTLGLNIGTFINDFQTSHHIDIHLSTLKHQKLSTPFNLFKFDLSKPFDDSTDLKMTFLHHDDTKTVTVSETGKVTAVLYWFDLQLSSNVRYSTLDSSSHIHQAAFLEREPLEVNSGMELKMRSLCSNSCLEVTLLLNE